MFYISLFIDIRCFIKSSRRFVEIILKFFSVPDEQDSMMYQSVGHEGVALYAEAMNLPLYTGTTHGRTRQTTMAYREEEGDEVEDLMHLLQLVKVSITMLSDY